MLATRHKTIVAAFWIISSASILILIFLRLSPVGWDLHVYANAIHSLRAGHDPYAEGVAVQRMFHSSPLALNRDAMPPYTYVYSPVTLLLLRVITLISPSFSAICYWMLYAAGFFTMICVCMEAAEPNEREIFTLLAPFAAFFPGLLQTNVIFSGNLAYILYGLVFMAAALGWRRGHWTCFYLMTLTASCCKAPLLSLLLIPVLSAKKQWVNAGVATAIGLVLFAMQPLLWPAMFHNYLEAVSLQFSFNHDFGFSPSGLLGNALFHLKLPYSSVSMGFYCVYAVVVLGTLFNLSRRFFAGDFSLQQWIPVMLLGVILLNPRIKEYDAAPLSLPMAMVAWRLFAHNNTFSRTVLEMSLFFLTINSIATTSPEIWKLTAGILLVGFFIAGSWLLLHEPPGPRSTLPLYRNMPPCSCQEKLASYDLTAQQKAAKNLTS